MKFLKDIFLCVLLKEESEILIKSKLLNVNLKLNKDYLSERTLLSFLS